MGFYKMYPLVNVYKTMEHHPFLMRKHEKTHCKWLWTNNHAYGKVTKFKMRKLTINGYVDFFFGGTLISGEVSGKPTKNREMKTEKDFCYRIPPMDSPAVADDWAAPLDDQQIRWFIQLLIDSIEMILCSFHFWKSDDHRWFLLISHKLKWTKISLEASKL